MSVKVIAGGLMLDMCASLLFWFSSSSMALNVKHMKSGYVKPGAAVSLDHTYDGATKLEEIETFDISLNHLYTDGYLRVTMTGSPHLNVSASSVERQFYVYEGSRATFPVQFSSGIEGTHYIHIDAVYESPHGSQSRRALSLPVIVGQRRMQKYKFESDSINVNASKDVVVMAAKEFIN